MIVTFLFTVYNDGTTKNLMSLTGTIPILFQGDFAFTGSFFNFFLFFFLKNTFKGVAHFSFA